MLPLYQKTRTLYGYVIMLFTCLFSVYIIIIIFCANFLFFSFSDYLFRSLTMKTSLRLALNAFLFLFILILPSLSSAQPLFGNYDDDLYQWNQPQLAYKRKAKPVSRSPLYNRKSIGELVGRMSGRRLVDDSCK